MAWNYHKIKTNKYKNQNIIVNNIKFDSKKEANRYFELRTLEKSGKIADLQRQVKYVLIPAQREADHIGPRGGIIKGKLIERECSYVADFVYKDLDNDEYVVEDTKGFRTPEYIIKRKLMLYQYGIRIKEI